MAIDLLRITGDLALSAVMADTSVNVACSSGPMWRLIQSASRTACAEPVMSRNETSRYTELQPDGRARQFSYVMGVKSLITSPSPGHRLPEPGLYELSGLAWSGRGRIRRVEVSADAGRTWRRAALEGPVLPMSFTRFRIPWRWNGQPAVLQSRAVDDSGALQPTRAALVAERGRAGYFHYNAIVSWQVSADGELSHVYA